MTLAEFLDWDDGTDIRHELIEGEVVELPMALPAHARIITNLNQAIGQTLKSPCFMLTSAGFVRPDRRDHFYVPDLLVTCMPIPRGAQYVPEPRLVIEVLSPSTRRQDRDVKLDGYCALPPVVEIPFVWSDERRAELWRRDLERWIVEDAIGDALLQLESVDATLPLAMIYDNVPFEPAAAPRQRRRR